MRLPTSEELTAFVSEEFETHRHCGDECVHYKQLKKLDKMFTCTPLYAGMMATSTDRSIVVAAVAGGALGYMAVYGLWLGLKLGFKLAERDGLERLMK